jgi:hypothetical protein
MSIRNVCRNSNIAASFVLFTVVLTLSTASADSTARPATARGEQPLKHTDTACSTIDRPKYRIRKCACTPSALAKVGSIDAAEILRLLTGDRGCQRSVGGARH